MKTAIVKTTLILLLVTSCRSHRLTDSSSLAASQSSASLISHFRLTDTDSTALTDSLVLTFDSIRILRADSTAILIRKATLARKKQATRHRSADVEQLDTAAHTHSVARSESIRKTSTTEPSGPRTWLIIIALSVPLLLIAAVILRKITNFAPK